MNDQLSVISRYLKKHNVRFNRELLKKTIDEDPSSPSLLSINEMVNSFGVDTLTVKLNLKDFDQVEFPVFSQLFEDEEDKLIIIEKVSSDHVIYFHDGKSYKRTFEEFAPIWTGYVVLMQNESGVLDLPAELRMTFKAFVPRFLVIGGILLFMFSLIQVGRFDKRIVVDSLFLILSVIGLFFSIKIFKVEGFAKRGYSKYCAANGKINCNSVLTSSFANILGVWKWSQIGVAYFGTNVFVILIGFFSQDPTSLVSSLALINILATFGTVYSIFIQGWVLKTWCRLCLICQCVIAITAIMHILLDKFTLELGSYSHTIGPVVLLFFLILYIARGFSSLLSESGKLPKLKKELHIWTSDQRLFRLLLAAESIHAPLDGVTKITKEANNPVNSLLIVLSPFCKYCQNTYKQIKELNERLGSKIEINFLLIPTGLSDHTFIEHFLKLSNESSESTMLRALDYWYLDVSMSKTSKKDRFFKWKNKFPSKNSLNGQQIEEKIKVIRSWSNSSKISMTPYTFVNGHALPDQYDFDHLKYLLD